MAAETVIVGCKLPNGLLLSVDGVTLRINGRARYNMPSPNRRDLNTDIEYADGLTTVDKAFWEKWLKEHSDYAPVKSGHIYASPSRNDAVAKAKDTEGMKTGLDPYDPRSSSDGKIMPTEDMDRLLQATKKR